MKILQYSIYDSVMELFNTPFVAFNDKDAVRIIQQAATPNSSLWQHSQDFTLHHVSIYDNETGTFENITPPKLIARVSIILTPLKDKYAREQQELEREDTEHDS